MAIVFLGIGSTMVLYSSCRLETGFSLVCGHSFKLEPKPKSIKALALLIEVIV